MDFLRCQMFRQTILSRSGRHPDYNGIVGRIPGLNVASSVAPVSENVNLGPDAEEAFTGAGEVRITTRDPIIKAALVELSANWPASLAFPELCRRARMRLGGPSDTETAARDARQIAEVIWAFYGAGSAYAVDLSPRPFPGVARPSARPTARPLARWQAERGLRAVTGLRHDAVYLKRFERQLLRLLDGTHDVAALVEALAAQAASGELTIQQDGQPVAGPEAVRGVLRLAVVRQLAQFARQGLLVG
jgi:methyltransferase-like protein